MASRSDHIQLQAKVPSSLAGHRLDQAASELFSDYSRSRLQQWIKGGDLLVDSKQSRPKDKLFGGELLVIDAVLEPEGNWEAEQIPLDIVYEDDALLVINKPAGLVVHPGAGNMSGTILNGLLSHLPQLEQIPRAGIVHRLDKDTTGLMVVAKSLESHHSLVQQLQARTVSREYQAVTIGVMTGGGTVDAPMGRHPQARVKMAVVDQGGKEAITHYRVVKRFRNHTHIRVKLDTGRTHQIRVHMSHIGYPLVGDHTYAGRLKIPKGAAPELLDTLRNFKRQALHAGALGLIHPVSAEAMQWEVPLPEDMAALLAVLEADLLAG